MTDSDPLVADFAQRFPDSFARTLGQGRHDQISDLLGTLPPEAVASVAARLPAIQLLALLESPEHAPQRWLEDASFDDAVMLLSRMRRERRMSLIKSIDDRDRRRQLLRHEQYPAHTVGSLVEDVLIRIDVNQTADAVVDEVRNLDRDDSPLLVLVDAEGHYVGVLRCWQLIGRRFSGRQLRELAVDVEPIAPEMPIAAAAAHESWLSHDWLPVVDHHKRVLGALSRKNIVRAASRKSIGRQEADNLMLDVVGGITQLLGNILDGLLAKRPT